MLTKKNNTTTATTRPEALARGIAGVPADSLRGDKAKRAKARQADRKAAKRKRREDEAKAQEKTRLARALRKEEKRLGKKAAKAAANAQKAEAKKMAEAQAEAQKNANAEAAKITVLVVAEIHHGGEVRHSWEEGGKKFSFVWLEGCRYAVVEHIEGSEVAFCGC